MNTPRFSGASMMRLAAAALVLSAGVLLAVLTRALHVGEPQAAAADTVIVPQIGLRRAAAERSLRAVFNDDPFAPHRKPAAVPYRLVPARAQAPAPAQKTPRLPQMLGTVVAAERSFATYDQGAGHLKHVRVGDTLSGYIVDSILRSRVVFRDLSGQRTSVRTTQD